MPSLCIVIADNPEDAAGPWGNPHCDLPYKTVVNLMEKLSSIRDRVRQLHASVTTSITTFAFFVV